MAKVRFDYSKIGLVKKDDVVTMQGKGINILPQESREWLTNYGLFVALTRTLAGHEKDSLVEKQELIQKEWDWLAQGMPTKTRTKVDAFTSACQKVIDSGADEMTIKITISALESAYNKKFTQEKSVPKEVEEQVIVVKEPEQGVCKYAIDGECEGCIYENDDCPSDALLG